MIKVWTDLRLALLKILVLIREACNQSTKQTDNEEGCAVLVRMRLNQGEYKKGREAALFLS